MRVVVELVDLYGCTHSNCSYRQTVDMHIHVFVQKIELVAISASCCVGLCSIAIMIAIYRRVVTAIAIDH